MELLENVIFLIALALILMYSFKKEERRQIITDDRYEKLVTTFVEATNEYMNAMVKIIDGLPERQRQIIQEISDSHLKSITLIVDELKVITSKVEENIRMNKELVEYAKR